jgi:7-cyano-7-deazaguanine synthase
MPVNPPPARNLPAVVLVSGGLDSATTLAIAKADGFDIFALSFRYGQRHQVELASAAKVAAAAGVREHRVVDIDLSQFGGSALTSDMPVPKGRSAQEMSEGIPITYVPARNTVFLALSLAWAEVLRASDVYIGVNAIDYSGYPDCRPEYIAAFEQLANLATKAGVEGTRFRVHAPLIAMTKADIIRRGLHLGVDYSLTSSCYSPAAGGRSCGTCDACLLRLAGFREVGVDDPIEYEVRG